MDLKDKVHMSKTAVLGQALHGEGPIELDDNYSWFERMDNDYLRPFLCREHAQIMDEHDGPHVGPHAQDPLTTLAASELMAHSDGGKFHMVGSEMNHVVDGSDDLLEEGANCGGVAVVGGTPADSPAAAAPS